jgi:hypothetical protein
MKATLKKILLLMFVASAALAEASASNATETKKSVVASSSTVDSSRASQTVSTLAQYRSRVHDSVAPLEELAKFCEEISRSEKPEVWGKEGFNSDFVLQYPKRERETIARVSALLPPKERIEWTDGTIEVDNTWVQSALAEAQRIKDNDARGRALRTLAERLRALDTRLSELESSTVAPDRDAERGRLNAILRDPDFNKQQTEKGGALQRLIEQLVEWIRDIIQSIFGRFGPIRPGTSAGVSRLAQVIVIALCVAVLAFVGWRFWSRRAARGPKSLKSKHGSRVVLGERLEADQTSADLLEAAERLARAGDLRGAIRKAYIALLCELGDRGVIRLAQHKTNRDYLQAVRRASSPKLYAEMLPLTFNFELHWYGLQKASETDWNDFSARCRQALKLSGV